MHNDPKVDVQIINSSGTFPYDEEFAATVDSEKRLVKAYHITFTG